MKKRGEKKNRKRIGKGSQGLREILRFFDG
jgi:hypothetical protein